MDLRILRVSVADAVSGGPVLDPDFTADVEDIVRSRKPRHPRTWC